MNEICLFVTSEAFFKSGNGADNLVGTRFNSKNVSAYVTGPEVRTEL
jgi:hypothetical protein